MLRDVTLKGIMRNELDIPGLKHHIAFSELKSTYSGDLTRGWITTDVRPIYSLLDHLRTGRHPEAGYGLARSYLKARHGVLLMTYKNGMYCNTVHTDARFFHKGDEMFQETDMEIGYINFDNFGLLPALGFRGQPCEENFDFFTKSRINRGPVYFLVLLPESKAFRTTVATLTVFDLEMVHRLDKLGPEYKQYLISFLNLTNRQPAPNLKFYSPAADFNSYWHWRTPPLPQEFYTYYNNLQGRKWTIYGKAPDYPIIN